MSQESRNLVQDLKDAAIRRRDQASACRLAQSIPDEPAARFLEDEAKVLEREAMVLEMWFMKVAKAHGRVY